MLGCCHPGGAVTVLGAGAEEPMPGRYHVEQGFGKGATGVLPRGKDLKLRRVVAIKTMAPPQEFEANEPRDAKNRYFREAEAARRLNHPHRAPNFDAGEEYDFAYIAMKFLKCRHLMPYNKHDNLRPPPKVMSTAAAALPYAHAINSAHQDIKPANNMYEPESEIVKPASFGFERIAESYRTKTGDEMAQAIEAFVAGGGGDAAAKLNVDARGL